MGECLKFVGYVLIIVVLVKISEDIFWLKGYDYGGIGVVVNYMFIMVYDWYYVGSELGFVVFIIEVKKIIEFVIKSVLWRKFIIGVFLYGYNWLIFYKFVIVVFVIFN